jgi:crotonobetainyl-CoA:carnitine CoA-transferase CaiB-like acyl-CoA transferase
MTDDSLRPLQSVRVVTLAVNLPGPQACARLHALGATVTKVEPPAGDPLDTYAPAWYRELANGQRVVSLDLKTTEGREGLEALLDCADLLVTSTRPAALERLGLGWDGVHARHPGLCHVSIVGHAPPDDGVPGHDLTYAASAGLVTPPQFPSSLYVDLGGAERAVSTALALLMARAGDGVGRFASVALREVAGELAAPRRHGLTTAGGLLGGGSPAYGLYRTNEGWIALAALEPAFARRLAEALGVDVADRAALESAFSRRTAAAWEEWARGLDLPIVAVSSSSALASTDG